MSTTTCRRVNAGAGVVHKHMIISYMFTHVQYSKTCHLIRSVHTNVVIQKDNNMLLVRLCVLTLGPGGPGGPGGPNPPGSPCNNGTRR